MTSYLEQQSSRIDLNMSGQLGSQAIMPVDDNKIVTSTNMKVGAYTIAAQPDAPALLSVTVTAVGTADTMGTITFVGTDVNGDALTEEVTPVADSTVYTTNVFATVTSATGAGWVIDGGAQNDTLIIGVADSQPPNGYYFSKIIVVAEAVVASQTAQTGYVVADLSTFTNLDAMAEIPTRLTKIALTSGEAIGILGRI